VSRARASVLSVSALLALETLATAARADTPDPPRALTYGLAFDGAITLAGEVGWFTAIGSRETIGPATCRWCTPDSFDLAARRALLWKDKATAETLVDIVGFAVGPALILGADLLAARHDEAWRGFFVDALLVAEAATLASDVNLVVRFSVARQRPWAWEAAQSGQSTQAESTRDANMSFFSGHATMMFAVATAAGTVSAMRGYRWTPLVWMVGLPLALATSYLRIASDDHWMSDILVGIGAGGAMGFAIPYFAHGRVRIVPASRTISLVGSF
jgi:membrane-associated phospholipid phosphatase